MNRTLNRLLSVNKSHWANTIVQTDQVLENTAKHVNFIELGFKFDDVGRGAHPRSLEILKL